MGQIQRNVMCAGAMGINHFFGCAVLMGVLHDTAFSSKNTLSASCAGKIAGTMFQGMKTTRSKTVCAFNTTMRHMNMRSSYGDQVFCEATREHPANDVFHPSQCIYSIDYENNDVLLKKFNGNVYRRTCEMTKQQIVTWQEYPEIDTIFNWWCLSGDVTLYDIQCWCKKICHSNALVHNDMVYFAHTKNQGNIQADRDKCNARYKAKMLKHPLPILSLKQNKLSNVITEKINRKQKNQRKLIRDSVNSRIVSENHHHVDKFTFGFESEDGNVISIDDISSITPSDWYADEQIPMCIDDAFNQEKSHTRKTPPKSSRCNLLLSGEASIELIDVAREAWKDRFGTVLIVQCKHDIINGKQYHSAHCDGFYQRFQDSISSTWIYSVYYEDAINGNMAFPKVKIATNAYLWNVVINLSTKEWRFNWMNSLLRTHGKKGMLILKDRRHGRRLLTIHFQKGKFELHEICGTGCVVL